VVDANGSGMVNVVDPYTIGMVNGNGNIRIMTNVDVIACGM